VIVRSRLRRRMRELGINQATPEAVEIISAILERQVEELLRRISITWSTLGGRGSTGSS